MKLKLWQKNLRLDAMSLRELWVAYLCHATVQVYIALTVLSASLSALYATGLFPLIVCAILAMIIYPFVWYVLHRFVLHGRFLYRFPYTASLWKRIHFDHHRDPHDLDVLFGALPTTLPTIALATMPVGYAVDGLAGLFACFTAGLAITLFYEFCHCIQHLKVTPKWKWVQRIKKYHLQHHFYDERNNFGITNYWCDRILGTFRPKPSASERSDTVFNLGYTGEEVRRYPWVAQRTADIDIEKAITVGIDKRTRHSAWAPEAMSQ